MIPYDLVHKRLQQFELAGMAVVPEEHGTSGPASFHHIGDKIVRLDWVSEPTAANKKKANTLLIEASQAGELEDRPFKSAAEILPAISSLSNDNQQKIQNQMMAEYVAGRMELQYELGLFD